MKIIVIGGTGTIGQAVVANLRQRHEVIVCGQQSGDIHVDIAQPDSIESLFQTVGAFDALISAAGKVHFAPLTQMNQDHYFIGLKNKLMGQVNLFLTGLKYIRDHGSFTLTSGILSVEPIRTGSSAAMVNGAIDSFVHAAAIEAPRGIRINAVSPTILTESMSIYADYFPGFEPVPATRVAEAYRKSVEGAQTGRIYKVGY